MRFRFVLISGFALVALALNLVALWGHSDGGGLLVLWGFLNIVPYILSMLIAGNPHSGSDGVICILSMIQWALLGYLAGKLFE